MNDENKQAPPPPPIPHDRSRTPGTTKSPAPIPLGGSTPPPIPQVQSRPKDVAPRRAAPRSRPKPASFPERYAEDQDLEDPTMEHVLHREPEKASGTLSSDLDLLVDAGGMFTSMQSFLEQELEYVPVDDRRQRALLTYEIGHMAEMVFRDNETALERFEAAFNEDVTFLPVQRALLRHYAGKGRWPDFLHVLGEEINATADIEKKAGLMTMMGEVLAEREGDIEGAIQSLKSAINLTSRSRKAAELLRGIYARQERWSDLLDILRTISNVTQDPSERARLVVEMAEICEYRLDLSAEAEDLYSQAFSLNPLSETAAIALRRLYLAHHRWKELAELLAREAGRENEPEERFADLYRAARIAELHLQDDDRAASLLETAAALRPTDPLPLQSLITVYQRTGRYEDLAAAISRQLRLVRDPVDRADLYYRLGRVYEDWLVQPTEAISAYQAALKEQPGHEAAMRALVNLFEQLQHWEELLDLTLLRAERTKDVARRADCYIRAAGLSEGKVKDIRRAVDFYDRAYRLQPGLPAAFRALQRIFRGSGQWEPLAELYERQADICKDQALGVSHLRSAAWIFEEMLHNRERAILLLEKLRQRSTEDRESLVDLARLYEVVGRHEDLRSLLEIWAGVTEDDRERIELRRKVGELLEGPLHKTEMAVDIYQDILTVDPLDRPTMERLKAIFERTGKWQDLVSALRKELEVTTVESDRTPVLVQIGRLCQDKLGDIKAAQEAFEAALVADENFTPARSALQELHLAQGLWDPLIDQLSNQANRVKTPARAAALLYASGEVCEERLKDTLRAEQFFNRALDLDPLHAPARQGLERIYLTNRDTNALESHYLREAENTSNPQLRVRYYLRLGSLFDGPLNDSVGAAAAYESALQVTEDQPDTLYAMASLLRRTRGWERLTTILAKIAGASNDRESAVAALQEWASILDLHLPHKWDPAPIYDRILEADPGDVSAIFALECLAFERGEGESLVSLALKQASGGATAEWAATLCARAAALLLSWGKNQEAADTLRRGLRACPNYLPVVRMLRRLDEQLAQWDEAADLLLKEGELCSNKEIAHASLVQAGNIFIERFGDVPRARLALEQVFKEDPKNFAAFTRLVSILTEAGEWSVLVKICQARLTVADPTERGSLLMQLASVYRDNLGDTSTAIDILQELLELAPDHHQALMEITELCEAQQRWRSAEEYLERLASVAQDDPAVRRKALLQRSMILEEQIGEEELALVVLQQLLEEFPGDREALNRCMSYYQHQGNWERTVEVLEELARTGSSEERVNHLVNLAEVFSRTLNDPNRAAHSLRRAARITVESAVGVERISEYFERRGDFEGLVQFLEEALDQLPPEGAPGSVAVRLALSRILAGRLLRPSEAEIEIRRALQSEPDSIPARLELAGLHLWGDNLGDAIVEYMKILDQDPFAVEAFRGLFRVYDRRGDVERAAGAAQAVCAVAGEDAAERKIAEQAAAPMEAMLASAMATPLGVQNFWHLVAHPDEPQVARELLYLIADYIPQIFAAEVDRTVGGNIIPISREDTLSQRCSQLAQVLGVDSFECCIGKHISSIMAALPGNPPRIVVDESFVNRASAAAFRFAAGRALAGVLTRSLYLSVLPPRMMELLLAATVDLFERGFSSYLAQKHEVEDLSRAINRAVPRRVRKLLEEPARNYAAGHPVAAAAWYVAAQRSAERAGLLLSGDIEVARQVLVEEQSSRSVQADLLRFSVGPHLYEARRRLGLSI